MINAQIANPEQAARNEAATMSAETKQAWVVITEFDNFVQDTIWMAIPKSELRGTENVLWSTEPAN